MIPDNSLLIINAEPIIGYKISFPTSSHPRCDAPVLSEVHPLRSEGPVAHPTPDRLVPLRGVSKSATEDRDHLGKFIDSDSGIFIVKSAGEAAWRMDGGGWGVNGKPHPTSPPQGTGSFKGKGDCCAVGKGFTVSDWMHEGKVSQQDPISDHKTKDKAIKSFRKTSNKGKRELYIHGKDGKIDSQGSGAYPIKCIVCPGHRTKIN